MHRHRERFSWKSAALPHLPPAPCCAGATGHAASRREAAWHRHQMIPALNGAPAAPALRVQPAPALGCH